MHTRPFNILRTFDWKHVLGELLLIVVGVLLALALNNWNTGRQERQAELSFLQQLRSSLTDDLARLKEAQEGFGQRQKRMESLRDHIRRGLPYADSLRAGFGAVLRFQTTYLNRSPYEVLKGKGLQVISNDDLRLRIVHAYDQSFADVEASQADDRNVILDVVRPYFLKAFRDIRFGETATPLNYKEVARDPFFLNMVDYRLTSLEVNAINPTAAAISDVASVIESLDKEITHVK